MDFNSHLYNETYRIPTNRITDVVYGVGVYHVVLCAKNHQCVFGDITEGTMCYSLLGEYALWNIEHLSEHYPDVIIHRFQIMPNHIHILLRITENDNKYEPNRFKRMGRLPVVVRGFKSSVSKWANRKGIVFAWQSRFYDAIIHDTAQYNAADSYIQNNVAQWPYDKKNNPKAIDQQRLCPL